MNTKIKNSYIITLIIIIKFRIINPKHGSTVNFQLKVI